jgi:hypothetical protein
MENANDQIALITDEHTLAAGEVLATAFFNDPLCIYTQPNLQARRSQFTWLFTQWVQEGAGHESVYISTTAVNQPDGVAVWTPPLTEETTQANGLAPGSPPLGQRRDQ